PIHPGDVFLLCSDGLNSMLGDEQISEILSRHQDDPVEACRALIDAANEHGGDDNITVIVLATANSD
ncbi:MAG: SpoIIE family protein phosphatase, partial [Acidobacteriota bacterium]